MLEGFHSALATDPATGAFGRRVRAPRCLRLRGRTSIRPPRPTSSDSGRSLPCLAHPWAKARWRRRRGLHRPCRRARLGSSKVCSMRSRANPGAHGRRPTQRGRGPGPSGGRRSGSRTAPRSASPPLGTSSPTPSRTPSSWATSPTSPRMFTATGVVDLLEGGFVDLSGEGGVGELFSRYRALRYWPRIAEAA